MISNAHLKAMLAGNFAAFGSLFGKLAFNRGILVQSCIIILSYTHTKLGMRSELFSETEVFLLDITVWILRVICFIATILLNGLMWSFFVESMQFLSSSEALVLNTGSNIIVSGIIGILIFSEILTLRWWLGAAIIVAGMGILNSNKNAKNE